MLQFHFKKNVSDNVISNQKISRNILFDFYSSHNWFDIPAGTPVSVALGDLQCSVRSTLICPDTDAVLNVSTSAQMAFVKKAGFVPPKQVLQSTKSS